MRKGDLVRFRVGSKARANWNIDADAVGTVVGVEVTQASGRTRRIDVDFGDVRVSRELAYNFELVNPLFSRQTILSARHDEPTQRVSLQDKSLSDADEGEAAGPDDGESEVDERPFDLSLLWGWIPLPSGKREVKDRVTSALVRAGRGLANWSVRDLAERSGVHRNTITKFEAGLFGSDRDTVDRLIAALESAGVVFINGSDGPGVRLRV